jgi:hypothetical protein
MFAKKSFIKPFVKSFIALSCLLVALLSTNSIAAPQWAWSSGSGAYTGQVDLGDSGALGTTTGLTGTLTTSTSNSLTANTANQPMIIVLNNNAGLVPEDACLIYDKTQAKWLTNDTSKSQVTPGYVCPNGDVFAGLASNRPVFTHAVDNSPMFWSGYGTWNTGWWSNSQIVYSGTGGALEMCREMGVGWHLPVKIELDLLYANRAAIGGFQAAKYFSASETVYDESSSWFFFFTVNTQAVGAYVVDFSNGAASGQGKYVNTRSRCVRSY